MLDNLLFLVWIALWFGSVAGLIGDKLLKIDDRPPALGVVTRTLLFVASLSCLLIAGSFFFYEGVVDYWLAVLVVLPSIATLIVVIFSALAVAVSGIQLADAIETRRMERRALKRKLAVGVDQIKRQNGWGKPHPR